LKSEKVTTDYATPAPICQNINQYELLFLILTRVQKTSFLNEYTICAAIPNTVLVRWYYKVNAINLRLP
jgi:hypothetical protein